MKLGLILGLCATLGMAPVWSQDLKKGEEIYKKCVSCHGPKGEGNVAMKTPRLAGQFDWYMVLQLKAFKDKTRQNAQMLPFVAGLSEQDMKDVSAFIFKLK